MMIYGKFRDRITGLSPQARKLFWKVADKGEEVDYGMPPDEALIYLHRQISELPDRTQFLALQHDIGCEMQEEVEWYRAETEWLEDQGFFEDGEADEERGAGDGV